MINIQGHLRIASGFTNVHIENVEFFHMGQQSLGFYPGRNCRDVVTLIVHFHMCGDVDQVGGYQKPAYVKKCSIHHTFSRYVVVTVMTI